MFKTIKGKITAISAAMLLSVAFVLLVFSVIVFNYLKEEIFKSSNFGISTFAQEVNKEIAEIESNALDLALLGEIYYSFDKNAKSMEYGIPEIFKNYPISLGGGIWFEPYINNPKKRWSCLYAYRNKDDNIVIDERFESKEYDYHNQSWYKEISSQLEKNKKNDVHWSLPYHEEIGSEALMVTAGAGIYNDKGKLVGISTVDWEISSIMKTLLEMMPTPNSFALFADIDNDYIFVSTDKYLNESEVVGKSLKTIPWFTEELAKNNTFKYHGQNYKSYFRKLDNGMVLIVNIPEFELYYMTFRHLLILCAILMFTLAVIAQALYLALKKNLHAPIQKLMEIANKIGQGQLNTEIKIEKPEEFAKLASTFNQMAKDIENITKEREKTESELIIAQKIQAASLPSTFPPFPEHNEFDIFATMEPAREVGGDFYDFYFIDSEHFMFLIADVSGKGVPAALFMMTIKTMINNIAKTGYEPKEIFETINSKICQSNQEFFVTMFAGIVNINTGKLTCVNCGHNPPLLKKGNGKYEYLNIDSNMVLGAFENIEINAYETVLSDNDYLYLYTDGVTETVNENNELYGENRLISCLNNIETTNLVQIISNIKSDIKSFKQNMPQSDDTTMLIFRFNHRHKDVYKNKATTDNYADFHKRIKNLCAQWNFSKEINSKIEIICEEIFINIASYAYPDKTGRIEVQILKNDDSVELKFIDWGIEYNPLEKDDPDVDLPLSERQIGGLGIFIVKQYAKSCHWEYKDGKNILSIVVDINKNN